MKGMQTMTQAVLPKFGTTHTNFLWGGSCTIPIGRFTALLVTLCLLLSPEAKSAPAILSGPTLSTVPVAPLSCVIELTTSEPARLILEVSDGVESWRRDFFRYATGHSQAVCGFKPGRNYSIRVSVQDMSGSEATAVNLLSFNTDPLPSNFPPREVLVSDPSRMEPGFTVFMTGPRNDPKGKYSNYTMALDAHGDVVWYLTRPAGSNIRQLANGNFLFSSTDVREMDILGTDIHVWTFPTPVHHDVFPTKMGTLLVLRQGVRTVDNLPTSETDPNAPAAQGRVFYDIIDEISRADGTMLHEWHLIDILDPVRIGYDSLNPIGGNGEYDWSHSNAVFYDPSDDSIVVSSRHQDAVVKFSHSTGELIWILGPHANWSPLFQPYLFEPVGTPFEWQYHQHAPRLTPAGTLLMFDNGNYRASPFDPKVPNDQNYSRAVEFSLDPVARTVRQVWEYGTGTPERLFSAALGDSDWELLTHNVLITFGFIVNIDGVNTWQNARLIEVTHTEPAEKVFELAVRDVDPTQPDAIAFTVYRAERIFDFYARGDLDMDGDVDRDDLLIVLMGRNQPALGPLDPRDLDRDGRITLLDARILITLLYPGGPTE